ncbi:DUF2939 domain-containing protein [Caulobacter sp. 17J80-11]|uniref:DUF2939 domain-containing protein n=1 Tax=Caulobacter sp. 17J80-11 TaxID=2763502 RepID=UPI0016536799|nr:DUF2939 domain-containing protein [Caulobacter sp. 17J80-11]MBC6982346.1 DUF2939 domain-containing protein [Caulobacter sp. 17J80-11]
MQRLLPILLIVAVLGAAGAFVFAPIGAFFALRSAAQTEDVDALSDLVDFAAVRRSLQPQLVAAPTPGPDVFQDPLGALKHAIEPFTAPGADAYLSPKALYRLTLGAGRAAPKDTPVDQPANTPSVRYWGPNRARLGVPGPSGETIFTFERKGLFKWKLVHLGLPTSASAATAPAATPAPVPAH